MLSSGLIRAALLFLGLLSAQASHAAVVRALSTDELCRHAHAVVEGVVLDGVCQVDAARRRIYTVTRIAVQDTLKGEKGAVVSVFTLGGTVGRITQAVPGAPRFRPGEKVLLFLWIDEAGRHRSLGLRQGVYRLRQLRGGQAVFQAGFKGLTFVDPRSGKVEADKGRRKAVTVDAARFRTTLRITLSLQAAERARKNGPKPRDGASPPPGRKKKGKDAGPPKKKPSRDGKRPERERKDGKK